MARKQYLVFINPMHGVQLGADEMAVHGTVLEFKRNGEKVAEFHQVCGWLEMEEKREPASVLSLVPGTPSQTPEGGGAAA